MDTLDRELNQLLDQSPSDEDIREVLEVLKKKKEETFKELEGIRDFERDEVEALQKRLKLLRGEEKAKSSESNTSDTPIQKAYKNLTLARSGITSEMTCTEEAKSMVLEKGDSELLVTIIKAVFSFVREEQQAQIKKIKDLLDISKQEEDNISNLQRTLGYDIEKALRQAFFDKAWSKAILAPCTSQAPYLSKVKDKIHDTMRHFVYTCIQLVWLMLLETPPLEFCWDISDAHYRPMKGEKREHPKSVDTKVRIIVPAIVTKQENGKMETLIKGTRQCIT